MPLIPAMETEHPGLARPGEARSDGALLTIRDLSVDFEVDGRLVSAVQKVSLSVYRGQTCALVGESGSGKSVTALSVLRLLPARTARVTGEIFFEGRDLLPLPEDGLREVRGGGIGMIFQEPMTSLNPLHPVGRQIAESVSLHRPGIDARERTIELLDLVGIPDPASRLASFPHQLSGGQRQRVMIAMALANDPALLIADEPTTALDVTIQSQVLDLLKNLQQRLNMAILLISHDLGVVRHMADEVHVMREGGIVECGPRDTIFRSPTHPYTRILLTSAPSGRPEPVAKDAAILLQARGVGVRFPRGKTLLGRPTNFLEAVADADLHVRKGESLGVVGESGSGKTTLGLALLRLQECHGQILFDGRDLSALREARIRPLRRDFQVVFQDPYGSLSPRMTVGQIVAEGLDAHKLATGVEREERIAEILEAVDLDPAAMHRYPHEFSGGQRQRISIARALILRPKFVVLDEPTSALDRTVQFQIVELLRGLQQRFGLTYLFITHDLALVRALCHRIVIMKDGRIVEQGATDVIFASPVQQYTRTLLAAALE
jgi:microcin C transport system ATP-binding protein